MNYGLNAKKGQIFVDQVWNREGTEKLVNGKQHSVWFVPTEMNGLSQNALLNFRLEFLKSDLTIYLPSGISVIFSQMVRTPRQYFQSPDAKSKSSQATGRRTLKQSLDFVLLYAVSLLFPPSVTQYLFSACATQPDLHVIQSCSQ